MLLLGRIAALVSLLERVVHGLESLLLKLLVVLNKVGVHDQLALKVLAGLVARLLVPLGEEHEV